MLSILSIPPAQVPSMPISLGDIGHLVGVVAVVWYFLNHLEKKDASLQDTVAQWSKGEDERLDRIERLGEKFDATVRQFQADLRTITTQMMDLHKSTIIAVTESSHAINEAKQAIMSLTDRLNGVEKRLPGTHK